MVDGDALSLLHVEGRWGVEGSVDFLCQNLDKGVGCIKNTDIAGMVCNTWGELADKF